MTKLFKSRWHHFFLGLMLLMSGARAAQEDYLNSAGEFDPTKDVLSDEYMAGPHLIYDCDRQAWICVAELEWERCRTNRADEVDKNKKFLGCLTAQVFADKKTCFAEQAIQARQGDWPRGCIHPRERSRIIRFE